MDKLWESFESELLCNLNPPAKQTEINNLEYLIHARLPNSFKRAYEIHNGQKIGTNGLFNNKFFLSINEIIIEWNIWSKL